MTYLYFPGCKIAHHLPEHGLAVEKVCRVLGLELLTPEFSCCGYPVRHESMDASFFSALRSLALAQNLGLDLLTPCKCCFGNFQHALHRIRQDENLRFRMKKLLSAEGLDLPTTVRARHLLQVLDQDVGATRLADMTGTGLKGLRVACHYGCHALRPENITHFDDPLGPTIFERLVKALGATPVNWELRLECCGYPLRGRDDRMADGLMLKKWASAGQAGADVLATACTYCQLQFGRVRNEPGLRAELYPVLLAHALGIG